MGKIRGQFAWVGMLVLALVTAACGGGSESTKDASPKVDATSQAPVEATSGSNEVTGVMACGLITTEDVRAVLDQAVADGVSSEGPTNHITLCDYSDIGLLVRVSPEIGAQEHAAYPFEDPQVVNGVGDDAKFSATSSGTPISVLAVLQGTVEVSMFYGGDGDRLEILKALAEQALSKL
jgi:hypothetical protein